MITIIDYGMGNLGSVANMIKKVGGKSLITSDREVIREANKIILPGVGAFDNAINNLEKLKLIDVIKEKVLVDKIPTFGVCLGMQLLTKRSEEGVREGFGFIDAEVKRFHFKNHDFKVPHMGWNLIALHKTSPLFDGMQQQENRFYFVHTYAINCYNPNDILATTQYGDSFVSAFERDNIIGCQFHPEKSHKFGMQLFRNFVERY